MTRETKVGLIVAGSFICLVAIVVVSKLGRGGAAPPDTDDTQTRVVQADNSKKEPPALPSVKKEPTPATKSDEGDPTRRLPTLPTHLENEQSVPLLSVPTPEKTLALPNPISEMPVPLPLPPTPKSAATLIPPAPMGESIAPAPLPGPPVAAPLPVSPAAPLPMVANETPAPLPLKADTFVAPSPPASLTPMSVNPSVLTPSAPEPLPSAEIKGAAALVVEPTPVPKEVPVPLPLKKEDVAPPAPPAPLPQAPLPQAPLPQDKKQAAKPEAAPEVKPIQVTPFEPPMFPPVNPTPPAPPNPGAGKLDSIVSQPVPAEPKKQGSLVTEPLNPGPTPLAPIPKQAEPVPMIPPSPAPTRPEPQTSPGIVPTIPKDPGVAPSVPPITIGAIKPVSVSQIERVEVRPGESSFAALSKRLYGDEKYAKALQAYNREHHIAIPNGQVLAMAAPILTPGQQVIQPPIGILERDFRHLIQNEPAPAVPSVGVAPPVKLAPPPSIPPAPKAPTAPVSISSSDRTKPYVVQNPSGERLRDIAERLLGDANRWPAIYRLNNVQPQFPIPAGTELRIPVN